MVTFVAVAQTLVAVVVVAVEEFVAAVAAVAAFVVGGVEVVAKDC